MQKIIAERLGINDTAVKSVMDLLQEGATIPFIARYRKERTGGLDETFIQKISEEQDLLLKLQQRKETIHKRLAELNISDKALLDKISSCFDPNELEDLYLPYRPKRKTRASQAREMGLEPLAKMVMAQKGLNWKSNVSRLNLKVTDQNKIVQGIKDIIAEWVSEHQYTRKYIRKEYESRAVLSSSVIKSKVQEASKYKDYHQFSERLHRIPSHRFLAIARGEDEGLLRIKLEVDTDKIIQKLNRIFIKSQGADVELIMDAIKDGYKRLIVPSIEKEILNNAKFKADSEAIEIFGRNLTQLLLAPPLGKQNVLAIDPGFRTGCKVACISKHGDYLGHTTIYPHPPQLKTFQSRQSIE